MTRQSECIESACIMGVAFFLPQVEAVERLSGWLDSVIQRPHGDGPSHLTRRRRFGVSFAPFGNPAEDNKRNNG